MRLYTYFRTFFWFYVVFCVFLFIFAESNVWDPQLIEEKRNNSTILIKKPVLRWDRFGDYVTNIPSELANRAQWLRLD